MCKMCKGLFSHETQQINKDTFNNPVKKTKFTHNPLSPRGNILG